MGSKQDAKKRKRKKAARASLAKIKEDEQVKKGLDSPESNPISSNEDTQTIVRPKIPESGSIPSPNLPVKQDTVFSFKYLDIKSKKFSFREKKAIYYSTVIERLRDVNSMTPNEIQNPTNPKTLRCHSIDWAGTSCPTGFSSCLNEQLCSNTPYQFSISKSEHGRVIGFMVDNIFYIVWFDPDHALYPEKKK